MIDLDDADDILEASPQAGPQLLVAANDGSGFIVPEDEVVAQTRNGKQF